MSRCRDRTRLATARTPIALCRLVLALLGTKDCSPEPVVLTLGSEPVQQFRRQRRSPKPDQTMFTAFSARVHLRLALMHKARSAPNERRCPATAGHLLIKLTSVEVIRCIPVPSPLSTEQPWLSEPNYPEPEQPWSSEPEQPLSSEQPLSLLSSEQP